MSWSWLRVLRVFRVCLGFVSCPGLGGVPARREPAEGRANPTQILVPLPALPQHGRPHWELGGRQEPRAFPERELQRQRQEA